MLGFFGQYLLEKGIITVEQLKAALNEMDSVNRSIGELAVAEGLLDQQTATAINIEQRSSDQYFGELAIQKGLLSEQQVCDLLQKQKNENIRVGEALVRLGHLTEEGLSQAIEQFQKQQQHNTQAATADGSRNSEIVDFIIGIVPKLVLRMAKVPVKVGVGTPWPGRAQFDIQATIGVSGEISVETSLDLSKSLTEGIAVKLLDLAPEELEEELLIDVPAELLNVMIGQFVSEFKKQYPSLKLGLPQYSTAVEKGIAFSIVTPNGRGNLVISHEASSPKSKPDAEKDSTKQ